MSLQGHQAQLRQTKLEAVPPRRRCVNHRSEHSLQTNPAYQLAPCPTEHQRQHYYLLPSDTYLDQKSLNSALTSTAAVGAGGCQWPASPHQRLEAAGIAPESKEAPPGR